MSKISESSASDRGDWYVFGMATEEEFFAKFRMEGKRFDAPGMPADAAVEVAAFKAAIFDIARQLWLEAHPDRSRVSQDTLDAIDLRLVGVGEGSSRPQMQLYRSRRIKDEDYDEWEPLLYQARDQLTSMFRSVGSSATVPANFPRSSVKAASRLGKSLKGAETITVGSPEKGRRGATLNSETNKVLARIASVLHETPMPGPHSVRGSIVEYDSRSRSFQVVPDSGPSITCRIDSGETAVARLARDLCSIDGVVAPDVAVFGTSRGDPALTRDLFGVHRIEITRTVWEKAIADRLHILEALEPGWNGPGSFAPSTSALQTLRDIAGELASVRHALRITATSAGAVAVEWTDDRLELTAEIDPDLTMFLCIDHIDSDELEEVERPLDRAALAAFVRSGVIA